ncbi:DUF1206 domain-containing protein [Streptomyces sp. HPF1205]|uniref:DUF1206 domain-containing protein n=1 Tax=Streptomyces sp. HPF1205 TaxID=2873262 RepID=UPI001CED79A2|nr:DUF1206 domain-containing protein [Streptomyces sp. HPF1205]
MSTHAYGHGGGRAARPLREAMRPAGRAGFAARGVIYLLVGFLALRIAFGDGGERADRQGALHQIAAQPFGTAMLWLLAAGLAGMALWRAARALLADDKAGKRAADGGRAVFYALVCWGTAAYAAGSGGSSGGSDQQSKDWTASVLKLPGGRWIAGAAGLALCVAGVVIAVRAVRRTFLKKLNTARMGRRTREAVTVSGAVGGAARGAVYAGAGVFVLIAAVRFQPHRAKGMDETLRAFAHTPAGPWLLAAVAAGLVLFGVFSFASARWRRL